jgi:chromosome segregation ATPase
MRSEEDRARRLTVITEQGRRLGEVEAERNNLRAEVTALKSETDFLEADRAARLRIIEEQGRRLGEVEADLAERGRIIDGQGQHLSRIEAELKDMQAEVAAQEGQLQVLLDQLRVLQRLLTAVQGSRVYRVLRRLGRWRFMDRAFSETRPSAEASEER